VLNAWQSKGKLQTYAIKALKYSTLSDKWQSNRSKEIQGFRVFIRCLCKVSSLRA